MKKLSYRLGLVLLILMMFSPSVPTGAAESIDSGKFQRDISGSWKGHRENIIAVDLRDPTYKIMITDNGIIMLLAVREFHAPSQSMIVDVVKVIENGKIVDKGTLPSFKFRKIARKKGFVLGISFLNTSPVKEDVFSWVGDVCVQQYDDAARADLKNACTLMEAYYLDNDTYAGATVERLRVSGLRLSEGVTLNILSADRNHYVIETSHCKGTKKYTIKGPI